MAQKQKDKLIKYLCMALPYGVRVNYGGYEGCDYKLTLTTLQDFPIEDLKPYLRPMSSMTDEEFNEWFGAYYAAAEEEMKCSQPLVCASIIGYDAKFGWLLAKHFDFMGLIPMGAAIEVTDKFDPYKD